MYFGVPLPKLAGNPEKGTNKTIVHLKGSCVGVFYLLAARYSFLKHYLDPLMQCPLRVSKKRDSYHKADRREELHSSGSG